MNDLLDTRQLRTFVSLARTGSFTTTAKEVFITQSAVSHSMRALETELGCRLFHRVGKRTTLTLEGEQLLRHADKIIADMKTARASLDKLGKWGETRLRLGATLSTCQHLLPAVLRAFKKLHPKCRVTLDPGDSPTLMDALRHQKLDLALALAPAREPALDFKPLFTDELMFIIPPNHPWVEAGGVARPDIARQSFLLPNRNSHTFRSIETYFRDEGITLNATMELGSTETIKALVATGLGISILSPWVAQRELQSGELVAMPLGRRKLRRDWGILHSRDRDLSLVEADFVRLCAENTANL